MQCNTLESGEKQMVTADVIEKLAKVLKPVSDEQGANAAVALLLKSKRNDFDVLFVKRVKNPLDPWSGQMSLPGGKRESKDASLTDTGPAGNIGGDRHKA